MATVNSAFQADDIALWKKYKAQPTIANRSALAKRFDGVIQAQVNKWAGPVSRDVLLNEAKLLAYKAFDTYSPTGGAALATHVTNCLLPLSRIVYTYQNAARIPENLTMKLNTYNTAVSNFKTLNGREPTTDEMHSELGWTASEINRIRDYNRRDLVESGPALAGSFFDGDDSDDFGDVILGGLYFELLPEEKILFEHTTGYNGAKVLNNTELSDRLGISTTQLSYKKKLLKKKVEAFLQRPSIKKRFA